MKKFLILALAIPFLAASCDTGDIFNFGGGTRGIFKSEDSGETFNVSGNLEKKGNINNLSINSLVFDTSNPDVVYAGVGSGIYKSEDAAKTWKYILTGISISSLSVDRFSPTTVYAAGIADQKGKIIKSTDGGASWTDIYTEPSKNNTVLAVIVSDISSQTVLAGLNNGELIRSTDAGKTWQATKDFSDHVIAVKFNGPNAYALTSTKGLFKSSDLGVTWSQLTTSLSNDSINSVNQNVGSVTAYFDFALDIRQTGVLYLGTEQGLFRSVDNGQNWSFLALPLKNAALRVSAITVNPIDSNNLIAAVGSTLYKSGNGGLTWETKPLPTTATIHTIKVNPVSPNIIYLGLRSQ